jgi:large subunit ribosomal protein L13
MKTFTAKPHEVTRDWYVVDASGKVLGRLAAELARRLRGKHKPEFTPHVDTGDYIVVVNADKLRVTGNKAERQDLSPPQRLPGRLYTDDVREAAARKPERVLEHAVKGMLPKGPLGYAMLRS